MIRKFQQGGQQQQQLDQIFDMINKAPEEALKQLAQSGAKPEDISNLVKLGVQQGKIKPEIGKAVIQALQGQVQKSLHGSKLTYLKSLKNQCPEGEELYYYKKGGSVGCGCKKKEDGGQVKKDCGGSAIAKFKAMRNGGDAPEKKKNQGPITQDNPSNKNVKPTQKFKNDYSSKRIKDSEEDYNKGITNEADAAKSVKPKAKIASKSCGSKIVKKFKKHYKGGTLNLF